MAPLYNRFLPLVKQHGKILDAGCGSGRDSLHFLQRYYQVEAFDASPALVELASKHIKQPVILASFSRLS
ncbi:class I SAM-dependent methyltransferase [Motilimonas pumila]|uniref:Class I SAM-dependent methyltransferase n=2 Tax=Motilimonas pumila TaxID=2303987 RepID=A0A418YJ35_9GAMM|nr:class I SAM-dependent methyltransferase [Motilimonas pumila]